MLSFKPFLERLNEMDAVGKAAQLDVQIAALDNQIQRLTKPLIDKKMLLTRAKQVLMPQIEKEQKDAASQQQGVKTPQGATTNPSTTQTTTPGSAGSSTPGHSG